MEFSGVSLGVGLKVRCSVFVGLFWRYIFGLLGGFQFCEIESYFNYEIESYFNYDLYLTSPHRGIFVHIKIIP